MAGRQQLLIVSDIHHAGPGEQERTGYQYRHIGNPLLHFFIRQYYRHFWLRDPFGHNHLLETVIGKNPNPDWVFANGDYSCDTKFIGVSDRNAFESAAMCLGKMRSQYGSRFRATIGDHELGKMSLVGAQGGMRLESWRRARAGLALEPIWRLDLGRYAVIGVTSSLIAFPGFRFDALADEIAEWDRLREEHLRELRDTFGAIPRDRRILLFCHDPTALPYLGREPAVREKMQQIEQTIIGHLHTPSVLRRSRMLAGMPIITFLGFSIRRMTKALHEARHWFEFNVRLCPSLAGVDLLKDGGYYTAELDEDGGVPIQFQFHPLPR
jgi:hypothetical protein